MNMTFFVTWILWSNQIGQLNSALASFACNGSLSFSIPICFHKIRVTASLHGCHFKCLVSASMAVTTSGCVKLGHFLSFFLSASRHLPCPSVRRDHQQQTKWAWSLHLWELQERPGRRATEVLLPCWPSMCSGQIKQCLPHQGKISHHAEENLVRRNTVIQLI